MKLHSAYVLCNESEHDRNVVQIDYQPVLLFLLFDYSGNQTSLIQLSCTYILELV